MDHEIRELINSLQIETKNVFRHDYQRYLNFCSNLHDYSARNWLLIYSQMPNATMVSSYTKWKSLGRYVKKGEKGLTILRPVFESNGQQKRPVDYKLGHVFDVSQTYGRPLPTYQYRDLSTTATGLKRLFEAISYCSPVPIIQYDDNENTKRRGYYDKKNNVICLNKYVDQSALLRTLTHEIIHAKLHRHSDLTRELQEIQAESITYVVLSHFGFKNIVSISSAYIAHWSTDQTLPELSKMIHTISYESQKMIIEIETILEEK